MTAKLLQGLGVVFVLVLVGGAALAFAVLKDRVRVVIAADEPAAGPDPTALLRDDVQTLARDVAALQQALAGNFEQLGNALEERATARHADVQGLRSEVESTRRGMAALEQQGAGLRAQLSAIATDLAAPAAATNAGTPDPTASAATNAPAPVPEIAPQPAIAAAMQTPPATVPATDQPAVDKPPAKTGFLSFSVPTTRFRFDALQDYSLVPELCRVGFDAKSTLHDFSGVTSRVRGAFRADFDDAQGACTGDVVVEAATLLTGVDGRDENLREHLDTKTHKEIRFVLQRFEPAANGVDVGTMTARGAVAGRMTIRGVERALKMPVAIEVDPQKRVVITGQVPLKLSDYGVPVPSQLGLINMQDEVTVWIALRARVASGGRK